MLPYGMSSEDLNNYAIGAAASLNSFFNSACLTDMKRLICASVYLQCAPGIVPDDPATYPLLYGFIPFPYKRPCSSVCNAVLYTGHSCAGLLEALGAAPDCSAVSKNVKWNISSLYTQTSSIFHSLIYHNYFLPIYSIEFPLHISINNHIYICFSLLTV